MTENKDKPRTGQSGTPNCEKGYTIIDVQLYKDTYGLSDDGEIKTQIINIFGRA